MVFCEQMTQRIDSSFALENFVNCDICRKIICVPSLHS